MKNLDHLIGKEYETFKGGRSARIVAIAKGTTYPVVALISRSDGSEMLAELTADLRWDADYGEPYIKEKAVVHVATVFINIYEKTSHSITSTREDADRAAAARSHDTRIACLEIPLTYKKGDGL